MKCVTYSEFEFHLGIGTRSYSSHDTSNLIFSVIIENSIFFEEPFSIKAVPINPYFSERKFRGDSLVVGCFWINPESDIRTRVNDWWGNIVENRGVPSTNSELTVCCPSTFQCFDLLSG